MLLGRTLPSATSHTARSECVPVRREQNNEALCLRVCRVCRTGKTADRRACGLQPRPREEDNVEYRGCCISIALTFAFDFHAVRTAFVGQPFLRVRTHLLKHRKVVVRSCSTAGRGGPSCRMCEIRVPDSHAGAKVNQQWSSRVDENVFRFQIAVDKPPSVQSPQYVFSGLQPAQNIL